MYGGKCTIKSELFRKLSSYDINKHCFIVDVTQKIEVIIEKDEEDTEDCNAMEKEEA